MFLRQVSVIPLLLLCFSHGIQASNGPGDSVLVTQCRQWAMQNNPLQQKKQYAESIAALQIRNLESNNLPRILVGGQATLQSDVFGLPFDNPLFPIPDVPKDQYKMSVDVAERIWDGRSDRLIRQQRELERDLAQAQVEVDAFQVRELVTDLFFKVLAVDETRKILELSMEDLKKRQAQAEAMVKDGVALRSSVDQLSIQMLKTQQQIAANQSDKALVLQLLEHWTGHNLKNAMFVAENGPLMPSGALQRPEYQVFALQERQLSLQKSMLQLKQQPRVEAFGQAGFGRPNPFNFYKTGFSPFGIIGLRVQWTPLDWGNKNRDAQALGLQSQILLTQKATLDQRLRGSEMSDQSEVRKYLDQLPIDDKIIALQEDIVRRAEAQVQNGVMTSTDYVSQINTLVQAKINRKMHEIQAKRAGEMMKARMNEE